MKNSVAQYLAEIGRKGGQAKSEKKRQANKENLAKARAVKLRRQIGQS